MVYERKVAFSILDRAVIFVENRLKWAYSTHAHNPFHFVRVLCMCILWVYNRCSHAYKLNEVCFCLWRAEQNTYARTHWKFVSFYRTKISRNVNFQLTFFYYVRLMCALWFLFRRKYRHTPKIIEKLTTSQNGNHEIYIVFFSWICAFE